MDAVPNRVQLVGYLEEALPSAEMSRIEEYLRSSADWRAALLELRNELDSGDHSIATIWRRHRLTCVSRERLGLFLAGGMGPEECDYLAFHLDVIKCRWCQANIEDLKSHLQIRSRESVPEVSSRRKRFFQTSVGQLPKRGK